MILLQLINGFLGVARSPPATVLFYNVCYTLQNNPAHDCWGTGRENTLLLSVPGCLSACLPLPCFCLASLSGSSHCPCRLCSCESEFRLNKCQSRLEGWWPFNLYPNESLPSHTSYSFRTGVRGGVLPGRDGPCTISLTLLIGARTKPTPGSAQPARCCPLACVAGMLRYVILSGLHQRSLSVRCAVPYVQNMYHHFMQNEYPLFEQLGSVTW